MKQKKNYVIILSLAFVFATILCLYARNLSTETEAVSRMFSTEIGTAERFKTGSCCQDSESDGSSCTNSDCSEETDTEIEKIPRDKRELIPRIGKRRPPDFTIPPKPDCENRG